MVFFFHFFAIFFWNFLLRVGWEETERQFLFSLLLGLFQLILALNEATMVFFDFFAIFMKFSTTRRVGTKRNDNFYFLSFSAFPNLFFLEMMPYWFFF